MMGDSIDFGGRPIHFIGIGGIGMSGLAYVLARRGLPVSGSDLRSTNITQKLAAEGAHIFLKQDASNLDFFGDRSANGTPQIICSTAIGKSNSELAAALKLGCPIFHRSDVLAAMIGEYYSIGVAGTHGKTTTSSAIGYMLVAAGVDPTIVVGGEVTAWLTSLIGFMAQAIWNGVNATAPNLKKRSWRQSARLPQPAVTCASKPEQHRPRASRC